MAFRLVIHLVTLLLLAGPAAATGVLRQFEAELTGLLRDVSPNIVTVHASYGRAETNQSGIVFTPSGYVLTAGGIAGDDRGYPQTITVIDHRDSSHTAMLFAVDEAERIAVLYAPTIGGVQPVALRDDDWQPGNLAISVGTSYGARPSASISTVAGIRYLEGMWLLSASAQPGFNGAAVFDTQGRLGGIVLGQASTLDEREPGRSRPAVMQSTSRFRPLMERVDHLSRGERRQRLGLGVRTRVGPDGQLAIYVDAVYRDGPNADSGVAVNDVILGVNNFPVYHMIDLAEALRKLEIGGTAELHVLRGGEPLTLQIQVGGD